MPQENLTTRFRTKGFNLREHLVRNRGKFDLEIKISVGLDILIGHTRNRDRAAEDGGSLGDPLDSLVTAPVKEIVGARVARPCYKLGEASRRPEKSGRRRCLIRR